MPKKPFALALALGFILAACTKPPTPQLNFGGGKQFVPQIVDFLDNVGVEPSITLDSNGDPHLVYFGFVAKLKPGQLPVNHPIGSPTFPAVLDSSLTNGVWSHGKVVDNVKSLTPTDVTGTSVAADPAGKLHVVYGTTSGLWYADNTAGDFAPKQIVSKAVSGSAIALDPKGVPWVSFYEGRTVRVGSLHGTHWAFRTVATVGITKNGPPLRTAIGFLSGNMPIVAFSDPSSKSPMVAVSSSSAGNAWTTSSITRGVGGAGIAMAVDSKGVPHVSYYTDNGEVVVATAPAPTQKTLVGWQTKTVGPYGTSGTYPEGLSTSIAVDNRGVNYVAWYDPGADHVQLASDASGSFKLLPIRDTFGGSNPVVAVKPDGSAVYLGWYDHINQNLQLGIYGPSGQIQLAEPSPTPATPNQPTVPAGATCKPSGTKLSITAQGTAFLQSCLAAPTGQPFTVSLVNKDPFPHDFSIYPSKTQNTASAALEYGFNSPNPGSTTNTYKSKPLKAGTYYFQCDFHPTSMFGTFIVKK